MSSPAAEANGQEFPAGRFQAHRFRSERVTLELTDAEQAVWIRYFDALEAAMHDFEVGLSRQDVVPLQQLEVPPGHPPEELRRRSRELYLRITELEFRAKFLREELRAQVARLPRGRTPSGSKSEWNYGAALDING